LAADYDYAFYGQSHVVAPLPGATPYGDLRRAYFSRTWHTFMGHQHAPVERSLESPVAVRKGNVLYLAAPLFAGYKKWDYWAYRAMLTGFLADLLPKRLLYPQGPGWVEATLHSQPACGDHGARQIVHLIAYQPRRSLQPIAHVDQAWAVADLGVKVRTEREPSQVYLAPDGIELAHTFANGYVEIKLPLLHVYAVVVIEE
jgi:hypothetical protein